jgi:NAD dependent epimerase/dehydratase family enzyme
MNASTATIYRHSFDRAMDEASGESGGREADAPASWRFSIDVATRWEASFFGARTPRTRKVALRGGMVMGPDPSGIFRQLLRLVHLGLGGAAGRGKQYMSWIHDQDLARAVDYLIEREEIDGVVNVTAPTPLPNGDFMRAVREAWGIGFGLPAREWMLRVATFVHRTESELLLKSRRVVPGRLLEHGFQFEFPTWPGAARDLVRRVREREVHVKSKERIQRSLEETRERTT